MSKDNKLPERPVAREELDTPLKHDLSHARDERCIPIAFDIVKQLAQMEKFTVGSHVKDEEAKENFMPIMRNLMKSFIEKELLITDTTYVFSLVRQALDAIQEGVDETLNQNMNRVTELVYGLPLNDWDHVSVKGLNDVVMRGAKIKAALEPIMAEEVKLEE